MLMCAALAVPLLTAAPAQATVNSPDTTARIGLFAQDWNGFHKTRTEAGWQAAATNNSVLVGPGGSSVYAKRVPQLHAWNPALLVLTYNAGPYLVKGTAAYDDTISNHPDYFAKDASGRLITVVAAGGAAAFPDNTLMDQGVAGWRALHANLVQQAVAAGGYDGAYIDSMGAGPLTGGTSSKPVNRATGQVYTATEWMQAAAADMNTVKQALGQRYLFCSGLVNGPNYNASSHILAESAVDGIMTDSWIRGATTSATAFPATATVKSNVDMVADLEAHGKAFYGWTKLWTTATDAQREAWNRYALAAYLLGKGTHSYYTFNPAKNVDRTTVFYANEQATLGAPLGPYALSPAGVFTRSFEHGSVTLDAVGKRASIDVHP
jgi:hypothetical protein